jgi:acetyltransferase
MRPDDAERERAFIRDLSDESRHKRFMCGFREAPPELVEQFVHANDDDSACALVAVTGESDAERIIGVARYAVTDERTREAELAVTVADDWQSRGVGFTLMKALLEHARARGIRHLYAAVLERNRDAQELARDLGFTIRADARSPGILEASIALSSA